MSSNQQTASIIGIAHDRIIQDLTDILADMIRKIISWTLLILKLSENVADSMHYYVKRER
jgi:hypothetical protein